MSNPLGPYKPMTTINGIRMQVYRTLRHLYRNESMWVHYRLDQAAGEDIKNSEEKLKTLDFWTSVSLDRLDCKVLPGTGFPALIGRVLIQFQWAEPDPKAHWSPTLRRYRLSPDGYKSFERAHRWYSQLSFLDKIYFSILE